MGDVQSLGNGDEGPAQVVATELDAGGRSDLLLTSTGIRYMGFATTAGKDKLPFAGERPTVPEDPAQLV